MGKAGRSGGALDTEMQGGTGERYLLGLCGRGERKVAIFCLVRYNEDQRKNDFLCVKNILTRYTEIKLLPPRKSQRPTKPQRNLIS